MLLEVPKTSTFYFSLTSILFKRLCFNSDNESDLDNDYLITISLNDISDNLVTNEISKKSAKRAPLKIKKKGKEKK